MSGVEAPQRIHLYPGEYVVASHGEHIRTLLGSCVSITLWHPARQIGAMSHYLLSERGRRVAPGATLDARYGNEALTLMLAELAQLGVRADECQAKVFGGGNMFPSQVPPASRPGVGERNGDAARELLHEAGIAIVSESLFGVGHRQIVFDVGRGDVWVRQVQPAELSEFGNTHFSGNTQFSGSTHFL